MMVHTTIGALLVLFLGVLGCGESPDNNLSTYEKESKMGKRLDALEKEVSATSANDRRQDQGSRLTQRTVGETNSYLATLYSNINGTKPQHLPEWQEMYDVLTQERMMEDSKFGLGPRGLKTNFQRLYDRTEIISDRSEELSEQIDDNAANNRTQENAINLVLTRLDTIDRNIRDLNKVVGAKFKEVDKLLKDFNGRIVGVENRMKTVEIDIDKFRSEFVEFKQRVINIEGLLRRYDIVTMHGDIQNLKDITDNHEERLLDIADKVLVNQSEIDVNRSNLSDAEQELSKVAADVGTLKVAVDANTTELDRCCR